MKCTFGYGKSPQTLEIPDKNIFKVLKPNEIDTDTDVKDEVYRSIRNPIGAETLDKIVSPGDEVVIITSDITRPVPSHQIIPIVVEELLKSGLESKNITIVFALGSHRPHTEEEMKRLVGEDVFKEIKCIDSNPEDVVEMGYTESGTPVSISRVVADADKRICIGNIEYHYFAGYSGGAKAIMPGVSTRNAIQANHSKMASPLAAAGKIINNPVRMDIEEAIKYCPIDFIVNVVLDENKKTIKSVAGDYILAHREGCEFLDKLYKIKIEEKADIVIVSQGGAPKDLNLYQTQKALDNSRHAVKDDGIIILVGACNEGMGESVFEEWMMDANSPRELIDRIQVDFKLGGHKAAAIALILQKARIFLVSEFEDCFVKDIFMEPFKNVKEALNEALSIKGEDAKIILMPYGGSTLPELEVVRRRDCEIIK